MLAPIRDYLRPKDPRSSPILRTTKDCYLGSLMVQVGPGGPGFDGAQWLLSEDVNAEYLLDTLTSIDPSVDDTWNACANFMDLLRCCKPRRTVLGRKIEGLPDDHRFKANCLTMLSVLSYSIGDFGEAKRLATYTLKLETEMGDEHEVAAYLAGLCIVNRHLGLYEEGIQQGREALKIFGRCGDMGEYVKCLSSLSGLYRLNNQLDAAEEASTHALTVLPEKGQEFAVCEIHRDLGKICQSKGEERKAEDHFKTALRIASESNQCYGQLFWINFDLANFFINQAKLDDAHAHIERAMSHTPDNDYCLGRVTFLRACVWHWQRRYQEARSDALRALEIFGRLGATTNLSPCEELLRAIEQETEESLNSDAMSL